LEANPDACAAQGVHLRLDDPSRVDGCGLAWNRDWQAVQLRAGELPPSPEDPETEIFGVSATAAVYRAAALDRAGALDAALLDGPGPFDPRLGSYYEDVDLACRLRATGARALLVPEARALHAGSATGRSMALRRWRWIYGNRLLVLARLLGRRFSREAPRILLRDVRDLARAAVTGEVRRSGGILAGWGRALRRGPAFAHRGEPLVPLAALERFRISSGHS
jgi:GT2 family glycosyltransferase